jgi:hypothetical protein
MKPYLNHDQDETISDLAWLFKGFCGTQNHDQHEICTEVMNGKRPLGLAAQFWSALAPSAPFKYQLILKPSR